LRHAVLCNLVFVLLSISVSASAQADSIPLSELGDLQLRFTPAQQSDSYAGRPMAALASYRLNEAFSVVAPYRVRQIRYLHAPGAIIARGELIARLSGPEVHHFMTEFEVLAMRLASAQRRFNSNRELYERQAIDEGRWIEISEAYYALQLEYEHMRHFHELLTPSPDKDALWLKSPEAGLLKYEQSRSGLAAGDELAVIIPTDALRLRVAVPLRHKEHIAALSYGDCEVSIATVSGIADDFSVEGWSDPLEGVCRRIPGERLMVTPRYRESGYLVPRTAVMQWQGHSAVLVKRDSKLETVEVSILASAGQNYFVSSHEELANSSLLTSSVSAVQGKLSGLGGE